MGELTGRQEIVLALVTRVYVATGIPVGSQQLLKRYDLGVSPATVRSEMAYLESKGYLSHPHTSAGRVPTELGYRYFVEHLVRESSLTMAEQRLIQHQFHQTHMDLNQWMKLAAAVLAHISKMASLVTAPRAHQCLFKHLELVSIREGLALLVVVLSEGLVKQRFLPIPQPYWSRDELVQIASRLSGQWENLRWDKIQTTALPSAPNAPNVLEEEIRSAVVEIMQRVDQRSTSEIYRDGLLQILRQPDFVSSESLWQVMTFVEERQLLETILSEVVIGDRVQVIIGGEGRWPELSDLSIILAPFGSAHLKSGVLGIVGPMRMPYQRNISAVRYMADLMTALDLYGES